MWSPLGGNWTPVTSLLCFNFQRAESLPACTLMLQTLASILVPVENLVESEETSAAYTVFVASTSTVTSMAFS